MAQAAHHETQCLKAGVINLKLMDVLLDCDDNLSLLWELISGHDAVKSPLQQPYDGPFLVIQRNGKFFTLNKNGCRDIVSIDRLKPAILEKMDDPPLKPTAHPMTPVPSDTIEPPLPTVLPTPSLTTRSGHTVHLPRR
ncbi:Hypothetical predicted protein [Paramuricea clavata]|uniref:Uncharacterized protein n=1 Tax=Paramuricea clavata TaxID=317549 RepID=A0A6S7KQR4_PARCT|nr:Hypothetical predicted protein [Paramuricea clavata]